MEKQALVRKDSWNEIHDKILADTIIESLRNGEKLKQAYESAANKLGRTPSACAFRWTNELKKLHTDEFKSAKQKGKEGKAASKETVVTADFTSGKKRQKKEPETKSEPVQVEESVSSPASEMSFFELLTNHLREFEEAKREAMEVAKLKEELKEVQKKLRESKKEARSIRLQYEQETGVVNEKRKPGRPRKNQPTPEFIEENVQATG